MGFLKVILVGLGAGAACYGIAYYVRQKNLISKTDIKPTGYDVSSLSINNAKVKVFYEIENSTDITFKVYRQDYSVSVNNKKLADVYSREVFYVPAKSKVKSFVNVEFSPADILGTAIQNIGNLGSLSVYVDGSLSINSGGIFINRLPMKFTFKLSDILKK